MSALVVWVPNEEIDRATIERFESLLVADARRIADLLGREREVAIERSGRALIGKFDGFSGVTGWSPWWRASETGIAWHGVVEDLLGDELPDPTATARVVGMLRDGDPRMADWRGRWAACAWAKDGTVALVCGATAAPSLWYTSGRHGWAAGSRIRLLLDLVGRSPQPDVTGATELVAFGFLIGDGSIYDAVSRLGPRTHVAVDVDGRVRVRSWMTLEDYLAPAIDDARPPDAAAFASRLRDSVALQLRQSHDPLLLLSGGRDSRAIGAAVAASGWHVPVAIGGAPTSSDHVVARQVAEYLDLPASPAPAKRIAASSLRLERLVAWSVVDSGVASLRQAIIHARFFAGESPVPAIVQPLFHGMGGEITRGFYYPPIGLEARRSVARRARRTLRLRVDPGLRLRQSADAALGAVVSDLDRQMDTLRPTLAQWLDIFYWQVRCLRWGTDLLVGGDMLQWHWTPLLDRQSILDSWRLPVSEKATSRWIERVTLSLAPELASVPYGRRLSPLRRLGVGLAREGLQPLGRAYPRGALHLLRRRVSVDEGAALRRLWREVFHSSRDPVWPAIISRPHLDALLETDPGGDATWALATVELSFRALA